VANTFFRPGRLLFGAGVALVVLAAPLAAQQPPPQQGLPFYQPPAQGGAASQPPARTQGTAQLAASPSNVPAPAPNPTFYNNVVVPVGGAYPYYDPYGGYLRGKADLVNASGQFMIQNQQAALMQQDVIRSQVDTRNKIIQQRQYEASITPNSEDVRMDDMMKKLRYSRNNPAPASIWSGDALNSLYTSIKGAQIQGVVGPSIDLPQDALMHINLAQAGKLNAGIGLWREGGKLDWPLILQDKAFDKDRKHMDEIAPTAVLQATMGKVDPKTYKDLVDTQRRLQSTLLGMVQDAAPDQYMDGKKYLRALESSIKLLQDPKIADYFNKWAPRGRTVAELVHHMMTNGLDFAPALPGDESYYQAVYQSFLAYDTGISQLVSSQSPR
jgi:hypothetical protein